MGSERGHDGGRAPATRDKRKAQTALQSAGAQVLGFRRSVRRQTFNRGTIGLDDPIMIGVMEGRHRTLAGTLRLPSGAARLKAG